MINEEENDDKNDSQEEEGGVKLVAIDLILIFFSKI